MRSRFAARLAWSSFGLIVALILGMSLLFWPPTADFGKHALIAVLFGGVGALVASRRQRNPIGWLFLAFAVVATFRCIGDAYAPYALVEHPGSLPGAEWVAWVGSGIWHPAFGLFVFAFLLFPNGRLPSPRWRPVAWVAVANYLVGAVIGLLWGPLFKESYPYADPPFQLPGHPVANTVFLVFIVVNFGLLALSAFSLLLRLRRATGVERQQLKWFVYAVGLFALVFPPSVLILGDGRLIAFLLPLVPAAAAVAVLRHGLYDIDVIINRTLVYGVLTIILVLIYLGVVVALQRLFTLLVVESNQLAVVATTLAIAALFNPLRQRIQSLIDRRFYRRKYDAAKTLDKFSTKLRDEVDLEVLKRDVLAVVGETMQPDHASLWLRRQEAR